MSKKSFRAWLVGGAVLLSTAAAIAGGYYENLPSNSAPDSSFTLALDTNYSQGRQPQTVKSTVQALTSAGYATSGSGGWRNALIGGDFGTNLWQRGTTSAAITTALLYGPDRWWGLSGTATELKFIKQTGASDITTGYAASARVQRTSGQTGVVATCVGQVMTSAGSSRLQGRTVEFTFHALAGSGFSPSPDQVTVTVAYGTGADESAANFSTGAWTGYTVAKAQALTLSTTWNRYGTVAAIPATATQVGVKICFTPVGTAGANDWFEFTGAQLDVNPGAVGFDGSDLNAASSMATFERRPPSIEAMLQYAYFYRLNEPASTAAIPASCQATGATANICNVFLPTTMRATAPTLTITTAGTFKVNIAGTPTTIASPTASTCGTDACAVTAGNTNTAGQAELLSGGGGTGAWDVSAEL